ncbi:MAG: translesion error-prone DNA polymerase V autoproteolytic subunit [Sphaerochaetaceae bacterium]|nr:translesion error-prone DNA polymerase V autoproteolytic subunit [Sphaerochaetaceae bacterium]
MKIQVLGKINCGFPVPGYDTKEESLDFNQLLFKRKSSTYCLRSYGRSMEPLIFVDDILVVDRALKPRNNDLVIAEIDGLFTAKRILIKADKVILKPENPEFKPIEVKEELNIFGVITAIVRQLRRN